MPRRGGERRAYSRFDSDSDSDLFFLSLLENILRPLLPDDMMDMHHCMGLEFPGLLGWNFFVGSELKISLWLSVGILRWCISTCKDCVIPSFILFFLFLFLPFFLPSFLLSLNTDI